jgi:hypothetical protein
MVVDGVLLCFFLTLTAQSPVRSQWLPESHRESYTAVPSQSDRDAQTAVNSTTAEGARLLAYDLHLQEAAQTRPGYHQHAPRTTLVTVVGTTKACPMRLQEYA